MDLALKIIALILSSVAILQLYEVRKKRHIDMFWKIYEIYTSDAQKKARTDTTEMRKKLESMKSKFNDTALTDYYSEYYHLTEEKEQKDVDKSIMNRIRFLNQIGLLLKKKMINKRMVFELIGLGLSHDYKTMRFILETHRRDHEDTEMYSTFDFTYKKYVQWKEARRLKYK